MKERTRRIILLIVIIGIAAFLLGAFLIRYGGGPQIVRHVNLPKSSKFSVICLEGHEYYKSYQALSPVLTEEGRPVKCL